MNRHFYHDMSKEQMLQLLKTASILEDAPQMECRHAVSKIHEIVVKALSFRCLHYHKWTMPVPLPDRVPKEVVLRSGRIVTVIDYAITKSNPAIPDQKMYNYLSCVQPGVTGAQGRKHVMLVLDGCRLAGFEFLDGRVFSTRLLREVVYNLETDIYECPIGESLEESWSLTSNHFWPKAMSFRLDDAMEYRYSDAPFSVN